MANIFCFESTDAGAPSLNNAAGALIALLDACLINGYNSKSVTSITVSAGVATVVCTAHLFSANYGKIIAISGATPAGLNISTRITDVTTNGFKYPCPGVADGVATGTIVAKYAPVGWTKPFSATNKAMYKRGDILASNCMLRVDDTAVGQSARCLMVQGATDLDIYYNAGPLVAQVTDGLGYHCIKGYNNATPTEWVLVSDGLIMFLFNKGIAGGATAATSAYMPFVFGDLVSYKPSDTLNCLLGGVYDGTNSAVFNSATAGSFIVSGGAIGLTNNVPSTLRYYGIPAGGNVGGQFGAPVFPSIVDGGFIVSPLLFVYEGGTDTSPLRGMLPGIAQPMHGIAGQLPSGQRVVPTSGSSRVHIPVQLGSTKSTVAPVQAVMVDLTGPWR